MEEWKVINLIDHINDQMHCHQCNNSVNYYYHMINKNGDTCYIDNDCLHKHYPYLKQHALVLYKQYQYAKTSKTNKNRMCYICLKHNINKNEPDWKHICSACYKNGNKIAPQVPILGYRVCEDCLVPSINPTLPDYRTKCSDCFKKFKVATDPLFLKK
ncbi:MAG TPA: hypothetical protein VLG50_08370 [Candidatus Saccharimonadales bacterium]|nr:hypothetical protein [Candidatus Saccharimonadales bacterium]